MDNSTPSQPKEEALKDKITLPLNLYVGKAAVDLLQKPFEKDYISGNPNLPEQDKQKNRKIAYALLVILIVLIAAIFVAVKYFGL